MKHQIDCVGFKPMRKGSPIGFATITIRELRPTIHDVTLHERGAAKWSTPPGKPLIKDGAVVTGSDGKVQYLPVLEFGDRATRDAFSTAVWRALEAFAPESAS
jgi:hypothetical protein